MRALSIRQPFAELSQSALIKMVKYRSRPTLIIGERFHIYAWKKLSAFSQNGLVAPLASRRCGAG
jgi:hypothetical protein